LVSEAVPALTIDEPVLEVLTRAIAQYVGDFSAVDQYDDGDGFLGSIGVGRPACRSP
jgi:hypothetical protein